MEHTVTSFNRPVIALGPKQGRGGPSTGGPSGQLLWLARSPRERGLTFSSTLYIF